MHEGARLWWEGLASSPVPRPWCSLGPLKLITLGTGLKSEISWPEEDQAPVLVRGGGRQGDI